MNISLEKKGLKNNDTITVRYGSDHPCFDCHYELFVLVEIKQKTPEVEINEHFGKLSIPVKDLLDIEKTYGINKFPFNYYEITNEGIERNGRLVLVLTLI